MCLVMVSRGNSSPGNKRHQQTLRLGQLPSSQWRQKWPHNPLSFQWSAPPLYLSLPPIKVWGAAYQPWPFDVNGNTNTDFSRVVTAYLFPLVIHWAPCWMCMSSKDCCIHWQYSSRGDPESALALVGCGKAIWLPLPWIWYWFIGCTWKDKGAPAART